MLRRALLTVFIGLSLALTTNADPAKTFVTGSSKTKSVYQNVNTGPMRTTLTRENKYPDTGQLEIGGFYEHEEVSATLEQDSIGVYGRFGLSEFVTVEASVPIVDAELYGESSTGPGDIELKLDLLAYQDIFQYPYIIPHVDVSLPTGDENDGLGKGDTVVTVGISIGTKVYDALTYVFDLSYLFDGGGPNAGGDDIYQISSSLVWDITDRLAVLVEGRILEENMFNNTPFQVKGGMAYRFTPDVQLAVYGGREKDETATATESFDLAEVKVSVQF